MNEISAQNKLEDLKNEQIETERQLKSLHFFTTFFNQKV
jgi:hypothetical protein